MPTFNKEQYQRDVNLLFVLFNLAEDTFMNLKPQLYFEYRLAANRSIKEMSKFNRLTEKIFDENKLDDFDNDKKTLKLLIEMSNKATALDKHDEFIEYLNEFFNNDKIN